MAIIDDLRRKYQKRICAEVIFMKSSAPSMADISNKLSCRISKTLVESLGYSIRSHLKNMI